MEDRLVWLDSSDGNLSLSIAYELKRSKQAIVPWDRWVWRQCFRPRNSVTLWKFLHVTTLFLDISAFFSYPLQHGFGTQLQLLWWGMMGAGFYSLWNARNSIRFDERRLTVDYLIHSIKLQLREVDSWGFGIMRNSVDELCIFSALGISGRASRTHQIHEVNWLAPSAFQLKVYTDGAARGTPRLAGYGGIFRDHLGNFMGCFAGSMGIAIALEAELQAIIHAVTIASGKGWNSLWIECDSAMVRELIKVGNLLQGASGLGKTMASEEQSVERITLDSSKSLIVKKFAKCLSENELQGELCCIIDNRSPLYRDLQST
ncbi:uncharacterized protein LOC133737096 [Rosa rugosa]|uniref:uncharacterized protein LOC133737096 n=1 Tax=Rosa rugosa TaxID=74645 RepID=UPI002B405047|nr:uncharacterized protein LOC133737096 [Rosa rugosa]